MALTVDIQKQLGSFHLQVRFSAQQECLALLGGSGCGKSVTLRCIAGILKPDEGHIEIDGQVLYDSAAKICLPPQKRNVGYLFQQYALFPNMTVRQNIAVAVRDRSSRDAAVTEKLRQFRLEDVADKRPRQLSGGQQQRTALARILVSQPKVILLDEPFSALDSYLKYQLELELHETLEQFPGCVLWVSHDRGEVWRNCRRVCVIHDGTSQPVVTMQELFQQPGTPSAARLSGCKNFSDAIPGGSSVQLPQWGLTLTCGSPVPADITSVGIYSSKIRPALSGDANSFLCQIVRVIDDLQNTIVLLHPAGAAQDAPLLRMEIGKSAWEALPPSQQITVSIAPSDLLLLK